MWIKIEGERITIKEGSSEHTYSYVTENEEFTRDSEKYSCMIYDGLLTHWEISHKGVPEYVGQIAVIQHMKRVSEDKGLRMSVLIYHLIIILLGEGGVYTNILERLTPPFLL